MKKQFILGMSAAVIAATAITTSAAGFSKVNTYKNDFADVASEQWYASSVQSAYELGFMKGSSATTFEPEGNMTVAEAITIASRVNDAYHGKGTKFDQSGANWYDCYVEYAINAGIITNSRFDSYERNITRAEMAEVFAKAVPAEWLGAKNDVKEIPDVPSTNAYYDKLLLLYNAGVIMGNDEFGTFKPNNNIIRAEAAAIIGRVALPEQRLSKTLVDANYGDAYYLVNHTTNGTWSEGATNYDTPWFYDNRNRIGAVSNTVNNIADYYVDGKVEMWRDFENITDGLVGWDFKGSLAMADNGAYFKLTDDEKNEVAILTTKGKKFFFNGVDTGVAVESGSFTFSMRLDLDTNKGELYINGKKAGEGYNLGNYAVSRMYFGVDKEGTGSINTLKCDVFTNYLVNDIVFGLDQWDITGEAIVKSTGGQSYYDSDSIRLSTGAVAKKSFNKVSGNVVFQAFMLLPTNEEAGYISLNSGDVSVAKLNLNKDGVFKADGTKLRHMTPGIWQTLIIEADTVNGTVVYKVNGKKVGEGALDAYATTVDNITIGNISGGVYFDDVEVYMTHEYDDYCPTPVPVTDDGYDVILNICSLWREGQHYSWAAVSGYPDIEPALGYYDEGLTEVADWEIKFMVENGIDVQHLCWYCPSGNISEPLKKSSMNDALHDGFFNAKYSDMMKFTFMWENSGVNCQNLDQFAKYIWSYWMDYYFLDDRFYTIDNKIVFTVWSYNNFRKAFGDTVEGAQEAVKWMNEDAKKHGFDGVMIFFADGHNTGADAFKQMADLGGTASYAYHWNQDGVLSSLTLPRLQKNQDHRKIHIVPTVSVGFNNIGWSGTRKPLATVEEHKKVASYIKDTYLPKEDGWKSKTLIVSTWNEYGEGTYVMPCAGLNGFGYLENIAEVFSGVTDHSNNIYPTEQQKARLGHMYYDETKTSIVHLDYEQETVIEGTEVLYSFGPEDIACTQNIKSSSVEGDVLKIVSSNNDSAVTLKAFPGELMAENIKQIKIYAKVPNDTTTEVFFTTDKNPSLSQAQSFNGTLKAADGISVVTLNTASNSKWSDRVTSLRFDVTREECSYEIQKIEFLGLAESQKPIEIIVDRTEYKPVFNSKEENGELYVVAEPKAGFFSLHNFYYEWSRFTGKLYILTKNDHEIVFTMGSDVAVVDGKETKLKKTVELRDGLPVLPLYFLYDLAGIRYSKEGNVLTVTQISDEQLEILDSRVAHEFEFNIPGDIEGLAPYSATAIINGGFLSGMAIERPNENPKYDPMFTISNLDISTLECNKIVVGMKHEFVEDIEESHIQIFFATDAEPSLSEAKSARVKIEGNSSDKVIEYVFDYSSNDKWKGKIKQIRVDPFSCGGSFEIDYIRFVIDEETAKANADKIEEQKKKEEEAFVSGVLVINGDAENPDQSNLFFGTPNNNTVSIVEENGNHVWSAVAAPGNVWAYTLYNVNYAPGTVYKVTGRAKIVGTADSTDISTMFHCNAKYLDAEGKNDHIVFGKNSAAGEWFDFEFEFEVPANIATTSGQFTFYTNPVDSKGVSYMFDDIVVKKK